MVRIRRDSFGIPQVLADDLDELFFGQGFATAQDRLWQLECDRRRAAGTLAEVTGSAAHAVADGFARRARITEYSRAGYAALTADARRICDAHTAGVNAWLDRLAPLSSPFRRIGVGRPMAFEPWECVAIFVVRHLTFATWQSKLWNARVAAALGPEVMRHFSRASGSVPVIVPPGLVQAMAQWTPPATHDIAALAPLGLAMNGSNAWAVPGPIIAGDPHRALEAPNVYYQIVLRCESEGIDAAGISFPGVPGMPHFGQTQSTAWGVTNAMADYQDLFIESLPDRFTDVRSEALAVRGGADIVVECGLTEHGPVVIGGSVSGVGLALRSTGLEAAGGSIDCVLPQLRATSAAELDRVLAAWVEPVNNFVLADRSGVITYRTAGRVPLHPAANAWLPVASGEWSGCIPDAELPRSTGRTAVVTANQQVTTSDYPHLLGINPAAPDRATRLWARIGDPPSEVHTDTVSLAGLRFAALAEGSLSDWDGRMLTTSRQAALFALAEGWLVRELITRLPLELRSNPFAGQEPPATCLSPEMQAGKVVHAWIESGERFLLEPGESWAGLCQRALSIAEADIGDRTWGDIHQMRPLRLGETDRLDLSPVNGANDCVMATVHVPGVSTHALLGSTARYVWNLTDRSESGWVVPMGASEDDESPHHLDQHAHYVAGRLIPLP